MVSAFGLGDFSTFKWAEIDLSTRIGLLRGPLNGLDALHKAGYMHRDITLRNILVYSLKPPIAVLCDYGKAVRSPSATDSRIGPIPTLAPEVDTKGHALYNNKIDIWGIGYVCSRILFNAYMIQNLDMGTRPDRTWHEAIMTQLSEYAKFGRPQRSFADLVSRMLAWDPADRPTAAEALKHSCMQDLENESPSSSSDSETKVSYSNKRSRLETDDSTALQGNNTASGSEDALPKPRSGDTQSFSSGDRRPDSGSAEGAGAAWLAFHARQARARAQLFKAGQHRPSTGSLLRRR